VSNRPTPVTVRAGVLDVELRRSGDRNGWPVVLLHGFPYDAHSFGTVAELLSDAGADVLVPSLRGFGGTRFVDATTMRSGQQAAIAQDIAASRMPSPPHLERKHWYQYYLHSERGRAGLREHRAELARLLWEEWSPTWAFGEAEFEATVAAFDNPDFVDVVVHSYRHRYGLVNGDPAYDDLERRIAEQPPIAVPTIVLDGEHDTVTPARRRDEHEPHFSSLLDYRLVDAGHDLPQEAPEEFARAVLDVRG
jgi:pimeloyl-ACP methyl ester carboxylesterase